MSYSAKIICDSISKTGKRLTTFEITFPRIVLAEFNTHRMFSRNSASSRAIPLQKQIDRILENPFIPEQFPINGKGMQPNSYIYGNSEVYVEAKKTWLNTRNKAIESATELYNCLDKFEDLDHKGIKIHKQIVNRLLEPFMWHTVIVTATEWDNFFKLRTNEQAQYEIRRIADLMYDAYHAWDNPINLTKAIEVDINYIKTPNWSAVKPKELKVGEWHLPFISDEDDMLLADIVFDYWQKQKFGARNIEAVDIELKKRISVARCARVSYLTHYRKRP
jgi:hypothetical protein